MDPSEAWRSFSRHHTVMEIELEKLREIVCKYEKQIDQIKIYFPSMNVKKFHKPEETPSWSGQTYRDKNGKMPYGIMEHLDWLAEEDFK